MGAQVHVSHSQLAAVGLFFISPELQDEEGFAAPSSFPLQLLVQA